MNLKDLIHHYTEYASESLEFRRNQEFNERLDARDIDGCDLVFRDSEGNEQSVAAFSAALFSTDLPAYRQLVQKDVEAKRKEILNLDDFSENEDAYNRLLMLVRRNATVIPFVGAGFSVGAGCPSWSDYITEQAVSSGMNKGDVLERLKDGEQEQLMDEVIQNLTEPVFRRDFRSKFEGGRIAPALSPAGTLVGLFDGCYITTNFDRVLEESHRDVLPFDEKVVGKENTGRFLKAIYRSDKYLLKLHGNIDEPRDRILTLEEYNIGYGENDIDYNLSIPKSLKRIFNSFTVLFVGCSLIADRYLEVLKGVYNSSPDLMPDHYAILVAPDEDAERIEKDRFLASHGITPIWFANGDWDKPGEILDLLSLEK